MLGVNRYNRITWGEIRCLKVATSNCITNSTAQKTTLKIPKMTKQFLMAEEVQMCSVERLLQFLYSGVWSAIAGTAVDRWFRTLTGMLSLSMALYILE